MTELRSRAFVVIRVVLGTLLLVAAALKIYGWSVSTVPPVDGSLRRAFKRWRSGGKYF